MGEKRIEIVTESMYYTLMAFLRAPCSGAEAAVFVKELTRGRVVMGPATLYTILGRFEKEGILEELRTEGRRRIYRLTPKGAGIYAEERARMRLCLADAEEAERGGFGHENECISDATL